MCKTKIPDRNDLKLKILGTDNELSREIVKKDVVDNSAASRDSTENKSVMKKALRETQTLRAGCK